MLSHPTRGKFRDFVDRVWRVLAKAHDLRNLAEYEGEMDVEERLVLDVITACEAVEAAGRSMA